MPKVGWSVDQRERGKEECAKEEGHKGVLAEAKCKQKDGGREREREHWGRYQN